MRFSAFALELARDSDKTFNLSTCLNKQYYAIKFKIKAPRNAAFAKMDTILFLNF